jgi:hypothetical protein
MYFGKRGRFVQILFHDEKRSAKLWLRQVFNRCSKSAFLIFGSGLGELSSSFLLEENPGRLFFKN